ncbi:MAG: putative DNA modification/repair radical SAM protein [Eubacteriales bacterium]|nr:putative DNA modification/repair radical SAM protein [Eubacteriales bacterium]
MVIQDNLDLMEKLTILSDAAKYDAACTSSGVDKKNNGAGIGNSKACGICHSFAADGRCISLLKILFTNECIYNCQYCINRSSNDLVRTAFTPEEVCTLTIEFYRRNYIEGLFLSSGIINNPDYTMMQLVETVMLLRTKYNFGGYIHLKAIPGASPDIVEAAGWYTDRMSVNLEFPTADGLKRLAPHKNRKAILTPMRQIQNSIQQNRLQVYRKHDNRHHWSHDNIFPKTAPAVLHNKAIAADINSLSVVDSKTSFSGVSTLSGSQHAFTPAGQSTQMIIGATPESDYHIVTIAEALYKQYSLKRVFYSAFVNVNQDSSLPAQPDGKGVPLLREHRLYQADWLMRFYGFKSQELLSEDKPNFNVLLDPKCDWAIRHLEQFPIEINKAPYYTLLRVPGIGVNSAQRIIKARRNARLDFNDIKKMGVVLKRALYFITCQGRMMYNTPIDQDYITNGLIGIDKRRLFDIEHRNTYQQLSLFNDFNIV